VADTTIIVRPNGPYIVRGSFELVDADGEAFVTGWDHVALCRCGRSAHKPFCDGTHARVGFKDAAQAGARKG
jgi:CDGSH-type Zn-finger protein